MNYNYFTMIQPRTQDLSLKDPGTRLTMIMQSDFSRYEKIEVKSIHYYYHYKSLLLNHY